ncbi:MAG: 50S ribosomal protein L21 [Parcubacteria group bacterium]|nr:50S ribosomal protein L21 [Parcubacteria group bacterium]
MKLAIIETGGKQYKVAPGEQLIIEKLATDEQAGSTITFDKVLLLDDGKEVKVGTPYVAGATVKAEVLETGRGEKVVVIRYKSKVRQFKKRGHRQPYTKVKIAG